MIKPGQKAPEFVLLDQDGTLRRLSDYKGRWVVLYFYPKDDTPGCTTEACQMRDYLPHFDLLDAVVLGVSADSVDSHKKFARKYELPFALLVDQDKEASQAYGVWGEKSMMGRIFQGIHRTTFIVNPAGVVAKVYEKVSTNGHAEQVARDIETIKETF